MSKTHRSGIGAALVVLLLVFGLPASGAAATFTALYAFGDSLSDSGNIAIASGGTVPAFPYDPQRFTNRAPVAVEALAAELGLTLFPSLAGGTNFAFGGARTGTETLPSSPGLLTQVGMFQARYLTADPNALYFVFAGGNDLRDAAEDPLNAVAIVGGAVANVGLALDLLYDLGARNFLVPNLPNIGRTPEAIAGGPDAVEGATFLSMTFNTWLSARLDVFEQNAGVNLVRFDTFSWLDMLLDNAFSFAFVATTQQCVLTLGCNPDEFIFWDGIHPTARVHELFGNAMAQAVPEPALLVLLSLGLAAGAARRRARR